MAVIVKRFRVRRDGKVYGPGQPAGQVITGLSKEEEARLIAESNGTIEKYDPPKVEEPKEPKEPKEPDGGNKGSNSGDKGGSGSASAPELADKGDDSNPNSGADPDTEGIAAVDPGELIKPGGKDNKKRGR